MVDVVRAGRPGSAMGVCVGISNCSVVEWKGELEKARVSWALQGREWQGLGGGVACACRVTRSQPSCRLLPKADNIDEADPGVPLD